MVELLGIIESWHQCLFSWNCALLLIQLILYIFCVRLFIFVRKFSVQVFKFVRIFNKFGTELTVFRCSTCKISPWFRDFFEQNDCLLWFLAVLYLSFWNLCRHFRTATCPSCFIFLKYLFTCTNMHIYICICSLKIALFLVQCLLELQVLSCRQRCVVVCLFFFVGGTML